jgi:hypothetical protein
VEDSIVSGKFGRLGLALLASGLLAGCGPDGPEIARVEGTVTLDGSPLSHAAIVFIPENGRPAGATTDESGRYVLNFTEGRQGAMPGKHRVRVTTQRDAGETADGQPIPASAETIPMHYNANSQLEFTVESGKNNVANFDLKSGGAMPEADTYK